jgi:peptide/nickel transport system permease protein
MAGGRLAPPSWEHWAGTDRLGRDFFTQIMFGSRIALIVGTSAVAVGALIGVTLGMLAAFATRLLDDALAATLDILIAFPTLLIAMLVVAASDTASLGSAILALGIALSAIVARLTRILAKRVLVMDYITAARTSGTSWLGIVFQHVLPNIWPTLSVNFALQFGLAVIAEASLSYLGLGAPPPNASWGRLLQEAQGTVYTAPIGAIAPGIALVSLVIGVNLLADGLRDIGDPTRKGSR